MVREGKFREDLLYRLNGVTVLLPPLRERMEDLPLLAEHFLKKIADSQKSKACTLHPDTLKVLMKYSWPGNIRELQNTLETAVLFADGRSITVEALEFKPALFSSAPPPRAPGLSASASTTSASVSPDEERILRAIRDNGYHKGHAATALGISRRNLYVKLEKYKLPVELKELKAYIDQKLR
jgi:two-component system response regulator HydG